MNPEYIASNLGDIPVKPQVVFHYFPVNPKYRENLEHFLLFAKTETLDLVIIDQSDSHELYKLEETYRVVSVPNVANDFGGLSVALKTGVIDRSRPLIFINSSMRGPFIPGPWISWTEYFTKPILTEQVDLVGLYPGIAELQSWGGYYARIYDENPSNILHAQTTAYAISPRAIDFLVQRGFFEFDATMNKGDLIARYEIRLSKLLAQHNFAIKYLLLGEQFNQYGENLPRLLSSPYSDVWSNRYIAGLKLNPFILLFVKTGRNIVSRRNLDKAAIWMLLAFGLSSKNCQFDSRYGSKLKKKLANSLRINWWRFLTRRLAKKLFELFRIGRLF